MSVPDLPSRRAAVILGILVASVFLGQLVLLGSDARFHGDEKYYTDAVAHMQREGDLFTPHYPDGTPRLTKPVLTYWSALAGMELFGPGYFGARFFVLLASTGTLLLTFRVARVLFGRNDVGIVAAAALIADVEFFNGAWRLNPDGLLTTFVTLGFLGFSSWIFSGKSGGRDLLWGYLGAGLAVATKGLLGVVLILYAWLFLAIGKRRRPDAGSVPSRRVRLGLHGLGLGMAATVGGAWYAAVVSRFGLGGLADFLSDQSRTGTESGGAGLAGNLSQYALSTAGDFLPAALVLATGLVFARPGLRLAAGGQRTRLLFCFGWLGMLMLAFSFGAVFRPRYLLPAHPLVAAGSAFLVLSLLGEPPVLRRLKGAWPWLLATVAALGLAVAVVGWRLDPRFPIGGGLLIAVVAAAAMAARRRGILVAWVAATSLLFSTLWIYDAFLRPVYGGSGTKGLVARLEGLPEGTRLVAVRTPDRILARIPLETGGRILPEQAEDPPVSPPGPPAILLLPENRAASLPEDGYELVPAGELYRKIDTALFWGALTGADRESLLAERRRRYLLAIPHGPS